MEASYIKPGNSFGILVNVGLLNRGYVIWIDFGPFPSAGKVFSNPTFAVLCKKLLF